MVTIGMIMVTIGMIMVGMIMVGTRRLIVTPMVIVVKTSKYAIAKTKNLPQIVSSSLQHSTDRPLILQILINVMIESVNTSVLSFYVAPGMSS